MQTLKTAVIVVLLLVVLYGVYEVLNRPPDKPPQEVADVVADLGELKIGLGGEVDMQPMVPSSADQIITPPTFGADAPSGFDPPSIYGSTDAPPSTLSRSAPSGDLAVLPNDPPRVAESTESSLAPPPTFSPGAAAGGIAGASSAVSGGHPAPDALVALPSNPGSIVMQRNPYVDQPMGSTPPTPETKQLGVRAMNARRASPRPKSKKGSTVALWIVCRCSTRART